MDLIAQIVRHLRGRPIACIFEQSHEKDNLIALKLMCILDSEMDRLNLYAEINATNPKLLGLLLRCTSFATFKYFDYAVKKEIGPRILRCKFCELVGPYACILSHMTISHNTHVGVKVCAYCNRCELQKHFEENTLDECYQRYIQQNEWHEFECNVGALNIVIKFFEMLKRLSKKFEVYSIRQKSYAGLGYKSVEKLGRSYGTDFPTECVVFKQKPRKNEKSLSQSNGLDVAFQQALDYVYGHSSNAQSTQREPTNHTVVIGNHAQNMSMDQHQSLDNSAENLFQLDASAKMEPPPMPVEIVSNTSYDDQQQATENEPLAPLVLCSTSTHQPDADEPMDNIQTTPNVTSSNIPLGSPHLANNQNVDPVVSIDNIGSVFNELATDAIQFGLFVAQRLTKLPDERSRRKLEYSIQLAILNSEREALQ